MKFQLSLYSLIIISCIHLNQGAVIIEYRHIHAAFVRNGSLVIY